ncbi:MAG TPA: type II secretion system protein [Oculatellaceae cyanobacterium]
MKKAAAFTLAELLIALSILGVIATFTVPKVLVSQQENKRKTVLLETISAINEVGYIGYLKGEIVSGRNGSYMLEHLNAIKICDDALADGCFDQPATEADWERNEAGVILHNGATIAGFNDNAGVQNGMLIDWNGKDPPNQAGEDQLFLEFCYSDGCADGQRPGTLHASQDPSFSNSKALFEKIFTQ